MSFTLARFIFHFAGISSRAAGTTGSCGSLLSTSGRRKFTATPIPLATKSSEELLVVVGGGAAGVFGAIRAKTLAPNLNVLVIEKGKPLSKVKISGGGRCNVTNGHCADNLTGKVVTTASASSLGKFLLKIEKRTIDYVEYVEADYLLIASGSSPQGYRLVAQLNHSIVDPVPSLFTFKIEDPKLAELAGVTFPKVKAKLKLENVRRNIPQLTQVGPMLVTHWGLSGPVVLRLSAWGARDLFSLGYEGILIVDFTPDLNMEDVKSILSQHKLQFVKQKVLNSCPSEFGLVKRFWKYILNRESLVEDMLWASISNNSLNSVASLLKHCSFRVTGKGQFKDEFVTAGGIPLSEISLNTMESKIHSHLYFAGEVLNVDGITGGYNFQNAWSGGYIAGTSIGELARVTDLEERVL
ncbi:uncharacterized protein YtfP isoform X4 [Carya illinoinensis]|uniref:uncharacterized protein YtfP isoform X4 n=1 Tax=Carya illinoinensis TaxID=32201 RepID=UPI001C71F695|nr:uncharacterized protein YtfP isoform X4 [Carya illinoinensis]